NLENNTDCACGKKQKEQVLIAKDMLPISFVEGDGFQELMEYIELEYTVPARKTIMARLEKLHTECAAAVSNKLASAEKVAIMTDLWTTLNTKSYVTITCHFIRQWKMESIILQTCALPERHTAENLADMLDLESKREKITVCVHDNASNIVLANTALLEWESNACFAHTLQLAINDGFKVSSINRVFHHSTVATRALKLKQQQQNLPQHRLMQCCKTQWSLNAFKNKVGQLQQCYLTGVLPNWQARTLEPMDDNWQIIEELLPVLHSLNCATAALCGESEVSISMMYPVTATLLSKHLKPVPEESNRVQNSSIRIFKAALGSRKSSPHLIIIGSMTQTPEICRRMTTTLREWDHTRGNWKQPTPLLKKIHTECDKHIAMATLFGDDDYMEKASVQAELENYILEPCIPPDQDPLEWWRVNENRYRKLARLAKACLCIPATSVPAERVFSAVGLIVNRLRSRLSPEYVDMLIFLNKN
uniref:HAT C-terminal dimerisation domain-containing protein n=1 Tax=Latimeria chalumnae TaxID=7897 RepID=H2ZT93_LATCH